MAARKISDTEFDFIGANIKADKENWIVQEMKAGEYFVVIKTPWRSFINEFSFSVYGPDKTEIEVIEESDLP